jgi:ribosomal protein S14
MQKSRNAFIVEQHLAGQSQASIARNFGISRERVRQILVHDLGNSTPLMQKPSVRKHLALDAIASIDTGHSVESVSKRMGLSLDQLNSLLQEQIGLKHQQLEFQRWMANQVGQPFHDWTLLSIEPATHSSASKSRCRVRARCERCQTVHVVSYRHLANGTSTMCQECGRSHSVGRKCQPVRDLMTGNIYPSIAAAAKSLGLTYNQAQYRLDSPKNQLGLERLTV